MKARILLTALVTLGIAASSFSAQAQTRRFNSKPENIKIRLEGTSNIHDWQVESKLIGGFIEVGPNFPTEPGQDVKTGKVEAKVVAFVPVTSLGSVQKNGDPYSTAMDDIMHGKFKTREFPRIVFQLDDLELKEVQKAKDQPYVFEATGELAAAGVTNKISMPVNITPLPENKLRITGTTAIKMTDFNIDPPAPKIALGMIKTGDDVKIIFDWLVAEKKAK